MSTNSIVRKKRELKLHTKLYEFFTAPVTKFWFDAIVYIIYLLIYSYLILVKMDKYTISYPEKITIAYVCTFGCEKIRELFSTESVSFAQKLVVWSWNIWNPCDMAAVLLFVIGMALRFHEDTFEQGRVIYCVDSIYWYIRILNIFSANKCLGQLVTIMSKMVKTLIYFGVFILIVLMSFGVSRQALLYPNRESSWTIIRDIFHEAFMLFGEVNGHKIDTPCGQQGGPEDQIGYWVSLATIPLFSLGAKILLINLLIAKFNNKFIRVNAMSHEIWIFERFKLIMKYEQKPFFLPPPFIIIYHIYLLFKYCRRTIFGTEQIYDNGLKLLLDRDEMERLYNFEAVCVDGYLAEQKLKLQQ